VIALGGRKPLGKQGLCQKGGWVGESVNHRTENGSGADYVRGKGKGVSARAKKKKGYATNAARKKRIARSQNFKKKRRRRAN